MLLPIIDETSQLIAFLSALGSGDGLRAQRGRTRGSSTRDAERVR